MRSLSTLFRPAGVLLLALCMLCAPGARAAAPSDAAALHLLNRLGYGPTPGEVARVREMGLSAYVESQLAPPALPPYLDARLRSLGRDDAQAREERLLRALASPRQLEEVLCGFWLDHFGIVEGKGLAAASVAAIAGEAVRPNVFGSFGALRTAVQQHPALEKRRIAGRGEQEALRALAGHFVSAPPQALVRSLARVWNESGGDQRAVLRALFASPAFLAPDEVGSKRKDALRFVASAVRASGVVVIDAAPLVQALEHAGTPVYGRAAPMDARERTDFVAGLADGRLALGARAPQAHEQASSAPPLRATVEVVEPAGELARPGPVLMNAPTPSAAAMAAARNRPPDADALRETLQDEAFLRY